DQGAEVGCGRCALGCQRTGGRRVTIMDDAAVPAAHEPPGDVGAHAPQSHDADLHGVSSPPLPLPMPLQAWGEGTRAILLAPVPLYPVRVWRASAREPP